jgi:hypothetical protein
MSFGVLIGNHQITSGLELDKTVIYVTQRAFLLANIRHLYVLDTPP